MNVKKMYKWIGKKDKKITITIKLEDLDEYFLMERLDLHCINNSLSYNTSIKKMMKDFLDKEYGTVRHDISNIVYR